MSNLDHEETPSNDCSDDLLNISDLFPDLLAAPQDVGNDILGVNPTYPIEKNEQPQETACSRPHRKVWGTENYNVDEIYDFQGPTLGFPFEPESSLSTWEPRPLVELQSFTKGLNGGNGDGSTVSGPGRMLEAQLQIYPKKQRDRDPNNLHSPAPLEDLSDLSGQTSSNLILTPSTLQSSAPGGPLDPITTASSSSVSVMNGVNGLGVSERLWHVNSLQKLPEQLGKLARESLVEKSAASGNSHKRKRFNSKERQQVNDVRQRGACLRCRIYKEKCDLNPICSRCQKIFPQAKIWKQPCGRPLLGDVVPFRAGNSRTGDVNSVFPELSWSMDDPQPRTIELCQRFSNFEIRQVPKMSLTCRRFVTGPTDVIVESESYVAPNGDIITIDFPSYACYDIDVPRTRDRVDIYIEQCQPFAERDILENLGDDILKMGISEARRYSQTRETIVSSALKIQSCVYLAEIQHIVIGTDKLGIPSIDNENFTECGTILAPIVLDYQLDTRYIRYMQGQMKLVIKSLNKLIFNKNNKGNRGNWYEVFLTMLVLLSTLESVYEMQLRFISRYTEDNNNFVIANFVKRRMIETWRASAKNLIFHFRCMLKAMIPFSKTAWTLEEQKEANLDDHAATYLMKMADILRQQKTKFANLREEDLDNSEVRPLVWVAQLFVDE